MQNVVNARQKIATLLVVAVQILSLSLFSLVPSSAAVAAVCAPVNGASSPTGVAANTFIFNEETCTWENAYYSWSPYTKAYTAKYDQTPVLNADGTAYEHPVWEYVTSEGTYKKRIVSTPVPQPTSPAEGVTTTNTPAATSNGQAENAGAASQTTGGNTITGTGSGSSNTIDNSNSTDVDIDITNNTSVITTLDSEAASGNATVLQNTNGGSATTGDATAIANYLSLIQSGWNPTAGALSTFNADLYGTYTGDMLFNPDQILDTGANSTNNINNADDTNIHVTVSDNSNIENNINLDAQSGDATVSENTNAGDATTGDATAIANLINMINSSINSSKGFIGSINIHGDFIGDFLLPPALLAQLQNTGANSNNTIDYSNTTNGDISQTNNRSITNNFDLSAQSGNANVTENTNAGGAYTGTASTNVAQQNYVGANANGQKGLLVFVNVLGKWVGFINPAFATIGSTGANSNNAINSNNDTNVDMDVTQNYSITNNINASATTGDATVSRNTNAGSARSGNAYAGANVLNLIDSNMNFSDWFGVLFINVFGSWTGSFGSNTSAGGQNQPPAPQPQTEPKTEIEAEVLASSTASATGSKVRYGTSTTNSSEEDDTRMLAASTDSGNTSAGSQTVSDSPAATRGFVLNWWILGIGGVLGVGFALRKQELDFVRATIGRSGR